MDNSISLTDVQINTYLANVLDSSLSTDHDYQALVASRQKAAKVFANLHLPTDQWQIVDDYVSAINECFAAYATAAYRLGFKNGTPPVNLSTLDSACLGIANFVLDTFENNTAPISWQASDRPELAQIIADVLADLAKEK